MNLVINGAEAIGPEGGTVLVRTGAQDVDEQYIGTLANDGAQLRPGPYVMLEVHDTGAGMSPETLAKIFDPFFTTKFTGRGLGLSAVQGIVRAHRGALKVYSQPGQGTTFKVLFPASASAPTEAALPRRGGPRRPRHNPDCRRRGDRSPDRETHPGTVRIQDGGGPPRRRGARDIPRAPDRVSLVLLDLTMPVMSGEQTLRELQTIRPTVRVLLTSGYNEVEAMQRFAGKGLAGFIQKPYTSLALAEKVKDALA